MKRLFAFIELIAFYTKEVVVSNLKVARNVLQKSPQIDPQIEVVSIGDLSERQLFILANMITMTPGTLSLDFDSTKNELTLHTLYNYKEGELKALVRNQYERRVSNVF